MSTGDIIKNLRIARDYTLEYVGNYVGVSKSTVKRWEDGDMAGIGSDKLILLAKLYGVTPHYIVGWEDSAGNLTHKSKSEIEKEKKIQAITELAGQLTPENLELASALLQTMIGKQG